MTRVPVPDDYERGHVSMAGAKDYHYGEADINLEGRDRARDLSVAEDEDGRYVGAPEWAADAVAEYLGVTIEGAEDDAETTDENTGDGSDDGELPDDRVPVDDAIEQGVCPWCDEEFENVPAHASQTHPEEWADYKGE